MESPEEKSYFQKEMEKLELQQKGLRDNYNQENLEFNEHEYVRKLRVGSMLKYGIASNETLAKYLIRLSVHIDISAEKNINQHVKNNGRGCWFTHKDKFGIGCFMCEDLNLIHYLSSIIGYFANKYPDEKISF